MDVTKANEKAVERILESQAILEGMDLAINVVPGMEENTIHHAGPPIAWDDMCGPMKGSIIGAAIFEELINSEDEIDTAIAEGQIRLDANHHHDTVGPMAGPVSASMPVYIVRNDPHGNKAYAPVHEGLGKVLSMGALGEEVIENLRWMRDVGGPAISRALEIGGEINITEIIAEGVIRGDELHNRCKASTSLFLDWLVPHLLEATESHSEFLDVFEALRRNHQTFATPAMAASKVTMDSIQGLEGSTIMTAYSRNGTTVGIRVSGLEDAWFVSPAPYVDGAYFAGYSEEDANPDLGDSAIVETGGLGGFVQAAAPAISQLVGRSAEDSLNFTRSMYEITLAEHRHYRIPILDFRGSPFGVDVRKVVETGVLPKCNTAISHKEPGIGMIGAGMVSPPMECFEDAVVALAESME